MASATKSPKLSIRTEAGLAYLSAQTDPGPKVPNWPHIEDADCEQIWGWPWGQDQASLFWPFSWPPLGGTSPCFSLFARENEGEQEHAGR